MSLEQYKESIELQMSIAMDKLQGSRPVLCSKYQNELRTLEIIYRDVVSTMEKQNEN